MRFLVDMPLSPALARWFRECGHDALHAVEIELDRATDADIIARARRDGRTLITADLDYPRLLAVTQAIYPSLVLFRDGDWSEADIIRRMGEIMRKLTASDIAQSIIVVERGRIRRRRLPIANR